MIEQVVNYWRMGGSLMIALAVLCYAIWFLFFRLRRAVRAYIQAPPAFETDLLRNLSSRSLRENVEIYGAGTDALSRAVGQVLREVEERRTPGDAFDQVEAARFSALDREARLLAACTAAAPLLGLLGTVVGMVATFDAVSAEAGNTAVLVSGGISQALITTQCGLVAAIPGLFGLAYLYRLRDRARVRLGECRTHLVHLLDPGGDP